MLEHANGHGADPRPVEQASALIAREAELSALASAYERSSREAGPVTVLIGGEAGIGKSRLVTEFLRGLPGETLTCVGSCLELGAEGLPFTPFIAVMRRLVRLLGPTHAAALIPDGGRHGLAQWLPSLGNPPPGGPVTRRASRRENGAYGPSADPEAEDPLAIERPHDSERSHDVEGAYESERPYDAEGPDHSEGSYEAEEPYDAEGPDRSKRPYRSNGPYDAEGQYNAERRPYDAKESYAAEGSLGVERSYAVGASYAAEGSYGVHGAYGRARLFEDILTLIERAAEQRPVVMVVEDLHWADPSSRELLLFLVRNLTQPGVLLLCTYRSSDLVEGHPLTPLITALSRTPGVERLTPSPLAEEAVRRLLALHMGQAPAADFAREIHRRSGGNPLFVQALADADGHVGQRTPVAIRDLLLSGFRGLSDDSRGVVRAAAVAGDPVGHRLLAAVTGLDDHTLETALRPAVDGRVLFPQADGYRFSHALVRAAVVEDLLPSERSRLHRRCAEALEAEPSLVPDRRCPGEVAVHYRSAGIWDKALSATWRAAHAATLLHAHQERLQLLERVLDLWEKVPEAPDLIGVDRALVLHSAAAASLAAGEVQQGIAHANAALAALPRVGDGDSDERAAALLEIRSMLNHRSGKDGLDDLRAGVEALSAGPPTVTRGRLMATLANRLLLHSHPEEAGTQATEALAIGETFNDARTISWSLLTLSTLADLSGDLAQGAALRRRNADLITRSTSSPPTAPSPSRPPTSSPQPTSSTSSATSSAPPTPSASPPSSTPPTFPAPPTSSPSPTSPGSPTSPPATSSALSPSGAAVSSSPHSGLPSPVPPVPFGWSAHSVEVDVALPAVLLRLAEADALECVGDHERALEVALEGVETAARLGLLRDTGSVLQAQAATSLMSLGRWREARESYQEALETDPPPLFRAVILGPLAELDLREGRYDDALTKVTQARELLGEGNGFRTCLFPQLELFGRCFAALGDLERADQVLGGILADPTIFDHPQQIWPVLIFGARLAQSRAAHAVRDTERQATIRHRLDELTAVAERLPTIGAVQTAFKLTFTAEANLSPLTLEGGAAALAQQWREAVSAWRTLGRPYELAMSLRSATEAALLAGEPPTSLATQLSEAAELAHSLGAVPLHRDIRLLATRARLPLTSTGSSPDEVKESLDGADHAARRVRPSGGDLGLTPREREVLRLVADGRSNRQIATALFIAPKTAGVHVSNILAKLGVASRTEAAALAHRLALFED